MTDLFYEGKHIRVENLPHGVKRLVLGRPEVRNAMDKVTIEELIYAISKMSAIECSDDMRLLLLEGEGSVFCAGADLTYMRDQATHSEEQNIHDARELARMFFKLASFPAPVVSVVQGAAIGGGLGLTVCSDYVVATTSAVFATSEVRLGIVPAVISPYILRKVGVGFASSFLLTGKHLPASEALHMGLAHRLVAPEELSQCVKETISLFLLAGPESTRRTKEILKNLEPLPSLAQFEFTASQIAAARCSAEGQAGLAAFFAKNRPHWCRDL